MNNNFTHKDIHKYTWIQPTKGLRSIINYVTQKRDSALTTIDVRLYRSAKCGSDHHMVVAKVAINYRITNTAIQPEEREQLNLDARKYNLQSIQQDSVKFLYKIRVAAKLQKINT